jgi:hypothetical protein
MNSDQGLASAAVVSVGSSVVMFDVSSVAPREFEYYGNLLEDPAKRPSRIKLYESRHCVTAHSGTLGLPVGEFPTSQ